jgi:hypothetical protein
MVVAKKDISVPKEKFYSFYQKFDTVSDLMLSHEWKEIFCNYYEFDRYEQNVQIHETLDEQNAYDLQTQRNEFIKCAKSFAYFAHKYLKIIHPKQGLLPCVLFKFQKRVIREYGKNRFNILSKFRQGGLTTISVLWALWRCMFMTDQRILVMSKTDREAIAAGEIINTAMDYLPTWLKPKADKWNEHEKQIDDTGSVLWFYTPEAARGKSATIVIVDEAAFIPDMERHWKGMYPTISTGGACCVISTVNGVGNWYEEMYHEAEAGRNPFNIIELDYWEHPEYNDPQWVAEMKANMGPKGWQQEVLRSFLGSGDTFISSNIIEDIDKFTRSNQPARVLFEKWANRNIDMTEVAEGALWIFREPMEGHEYVMGVDVAEGVGEEGDNSAFEIIDQNTIEQVAEFYSNSVPPHIFSQIINEIGYYYNTALVVVENKNQGTAVLSALQYDLAYENIFYDEKSRRQTAGVKTGKDNRPMCLEALQNRLMNRVVRINSRRFTKELKTFIYNKNSKKPEAQRGRHDDAIMAMAMALYIRDNMTRGLPPGAEAPKEMVQIFDSDVYEEIKEEVMKGIPEDWLTEEEEATPLLPPEDEDMPLYFKKRKHDKLLKEFGW